MEEIEHGFYPDRQPYILRQCCWETANKLDIYGGYILVDKAYGVTSIGTYIHEYSGEYMVPLCRNIKKHENMIANATSIVK